MDVARQKNEKLNDLEEEAKEKAQHLLSKANEMRQEEEDEIKHLNEVRSPQHIPGLLVGKGMLNGIRMLTSKAKITTNCFLMWEVVVVLQAT